MSKNNIQKMDAEELAYWYFRLNGFFSITNFVVHPNLGHNQITDVDIYGVRFPYRAELLDKPMEDDSIFTKHSDKPYIILAEVKTKTCKINNSWLKKDNKSLEFIISALGTHKKVNIENIAINLYEYGYYEDDYYLISLVCVGDRKNDRISEVYRAIPQITWSSMLKFIYNRFKKYRLEKSAHPQWTPVGKKLYKRCFESSNEKDFISSIRKEVIAAE